MSVYLRIAGSHSACRHRKTQTAALSAMRPLNDSQKGFPLPGVSAGFAILALLIVLLLLILTVATRGGQTPLKDLTDVENDSIDDYDTEAPVRKRMRKDLAAEPARTGYDYEASDSDDTGMC